MPTARKAEGSRPVFDFSVYGARSFASGASPDAAPLLRRRAYRISFSQLPPRSTANRSGISTTNLAMECGLTTGVAYLSIHPCRHGRCRSLWQSWAELRPSTRSRLPQISHRYHLHAGTGLLADVLAVVAARRSRVDAKQSAKATGAAGCTN
ncbi:hypothetical protein KCP69_26630 (plasmid) [Salmonella enterica subsp. enterica]|nr:hypothetical protein KCP69_26630 [Salmonella enterica subsp. enterica]